MGKLIMASLFVGGFLWGFARARARMCRSCARQTCVCDPFKHFLN